MRKNTIDKSAEAIGAIVNKQLSAYVKKQLGVGEPPEIAVKHVDKNCLSYWFPLLAASGVNVPATKIIKFENELELVRLLDGRIPRGFTKFAMRVLMSANEIGYPCFMRTGQGSGKHEWEHTCFIPGPDAIISHIQRLVNWSHCVDFVGLSCNTWVVRELLNLEYAFKAFCGLPIAKERRYFIKDGKVVCHHPYWPEDAFRHDEPDVANWRAILSEFNEESPEEVEELTHLSERVSNAVEGDWSLDWAKAKNGKWYAIDMAIAHRSYHWRGCDAKESL